MPFAGVGGTSVRAEQYLIDNSLRFNDNDSAHLGRTFSAGDRRTFTFSFWFKRGNIGSIQHFFSNQNDLFGIESGDYIFFNFNGASAGTFSFANTLLRDVSAWYHIVLTVDTTDATGADRLKLYINGERITPSSSTPPSQNYQTNIDAAQVQVIGKRQSNGDRYLDGYLSEFVFIDGTALTPSSFAEADEGSGIWKPIDVSGLDYSGVNSFYLDFENSGSLGTDVSGNSNNWTTSGIASTDQTTDTPTNNFCTMNPLEYTGATYGTGTLSEGNCKVTLGDNNTNVASFTVNQGKWYWEQKYISSASSQNRIEFGIIQQDVPDYIGGDSTPNQSGKGLVWAGFGDLRGYISTSSFGTFAPNDIIGCALDMDAQTLQFYKNGSAVSTAQDFSGAGWTNVAPTVFCSNNAGNEVGEINFGNPSFSISSGNSDDNGYGNFEYAPPSGYLALCTQNLATELSPTIDDGSQYFNTVLYTGNGSTQSITGVGFQPDWTWIKERSSTSGHEVYDSTRGATKLLSPNTSDAEGTNASALTSFDSDGFSVGSGGAVNENSQTYVGWNWLANGGTTSSNTDGSITSTVQANTTAGFSIVTYTGTGSAGSVGHGLGVAPKWVLPKSRNATDGWASWHTGLSGSGYILSLQSTAVEFNNGTSSYSDFPSSSVINFGGDYSVSGRTYVVYCFADIEGYSKFGSYTGNANADGPFVYTGFRPAFLLGRRINNVSNWIMFDNKRNTFNDVDKQFFPNASNAESTTTTNNVDFLSNGFKVRGSGGTLNGSGSTVIYIAFAENPFVSSSAIPVVAR